VGVLSARSCVLARPMSECDVAIVARPEIITMRRKNEL